MSHAHSVTPTIIMEGLQTMNEHETGGGDFRRRSLLGVAVAAVSAFTLGRTVTLHTDRTDDDVSMIEPVGQDRDSAARIQNHLDGGGTIALGAGEFHLYRPLSVSKSGTMLTLSQNTVLVSRHSGPVIMCERSDRFVLEGNGALIDLMGRSPSGVRIGGDGESRLVTQAQISNLRIANNHALEPLNAAIEIRNADDVLISGLRVSDYGSKQDPNEVKNEAGDANGQVYSLGVFTSQQVEVRDSQFADGCIGVLVQASREVVLRSLRIDRMSDNGIYILSGSSSIDVRDSLIAQCEEGIAVLSDDVRIFDSHLSLCSNKGITLRKTSRCSISRCSFSANRVGIGDDGKPESYASSVMIIDNDFDSSQESISLARCRDSTVRGNIVRRTGETDGPIVRLQAVRNTLLISNHVVGDSGQITHGIAIESDSEDVLIATNMFTACAAAVSFKPEGSLRPLRTRLTSNVIEERMQLIANAAGADGTVVQD